MAAEAMQKLRLSIPNPPPLLYQNIYEVRLVANQAKSRLHNVEHEALPEATKSRANQN